jgi:hypothetical protein
MSAKKGTPKDTRGSTRQAPYRAAAVKRILKAKNSPSDPSAPTDPTEFLAWLNTPSAARLNTVARKVWVCERLNRSGHGWHVWFTHATRSVTHRNMRVSRGLHPQETFRTVPYTPGGGT